MTDSTSAFVNPLGTYKGVRKLHCLWILALLASFGPLCTDMYLPALPSIASDLGIPVTMAQASMTACLIGLSVGQLIIGPMSDGMGRKNLLIVTLVVFVLASAGCALTRNGYVFLLLRLLQGLSGAGGLVISRAISCDTYRGLALTQFIAILMAIHSVAPTLGPVLGGFVAASLGWQAIFWVLAAIALYLVIGTALQIPETLDPEKRVPGGTIPALVNMFGLCKEYAYCAYCTLHGFTMAGFFCYIAASPFVFQNIYHLSIREFSLLFGGIATCNMLFSLAAAPLSRRFGNRMVLLVADICRAACCVGVLVVVLLEPASPVPLMLALGLMVALQGTTITASFSLAVESQTTGSGAATGVIGVVIFICGAITSPIAGVCGPHSALPLGIVCAVTGLLALSMTILGNKLYSSSPARGMSLVRRLHRAREAKARAMARGKEFHLARRARRHD